MELSTAPNVGVSIKHKQVQLYQMCHEYLIDNFHKFSEANKIKIALALASKLAPQEIEGKVGVTLTAMGTVKIGDKLMELDIG